RPSCPVDRTGRVSLRGFAARRGGGAARLVVEPGVEEASAGTGKVDGSTGGARFMISRMAWPAERLDEALQALAWKVALWGGPLGPRPAPWPASAEAHHGIEKSRPGGRLRPEGAAPQTTTLQESGEGIGPWMEAAAASLGLEAESVEARFADVEELLRAGPTLLRLPGNGQPSFVALLGTRSGRKVDILGPDLSVTRAPLEEVRTALCEPIEAPHLAEVNRLLDDAGIAPRRRVRVRQAILREKLGGVRVAEAWRLRVPPGSSFPQQLRRAKLPARLAALVASHGIGYVLWIFSWWMVGRAALGGRLDRGWLAA